MMIAMTRLYVDFDPPQPDDPDFATDTAHLVYFLSWAYATRFGANHEMSIASLVLKSQFKVDLTPLLTFADRSVEDADDIEALASAWQASAPLAECCRQITAAFAAGDNRLDGLEAEYPGLAASIAELGRLADLADSRGARVRLSYEIEDAV